MQDTKVSIRKTARRTSDVRGFCLRAGRLQKPAGAA